MQIAYSKIARNQLACDRAVPVDGRPTVYKVEGVPGLELYVAPTGAKSWRLRYQVGQGASRKFRSHKIGDARVVRLGQAADKARELLAGLQLDGRDPNADRHSETETLGWLIRSWLDMRKQRGDRSHGADLSVFARHMQAIADAPLATLRRRDISEFVDGLAKVTTPSQQDRVQFIISAALSYGVNAGVIDSNPAMRLRKRASRKSRTSVWSDDELRKIWPVFDTLESPHVARVLKLLLLTGQRRSEVAGMLRGELDADLWTVGDRTGNKTGRPNTIPLTPVAMKIVADTLAEHKGEHLFRARDGGPLDPHSVTTALTRCCAKVGVVGRTVHDLRRTLATGLARLGIDLDTRERILNHASAMQRSMTTAVYDRYDYVPQKRRALELWEARLLEIVEGRPASGARW